MAKTYTPNPIVRSTGLAAGAKFALRCYARAQVWRTGPRILVNSIPKSGTHLVTGLLTEVPGLMNARLHIETWRVNRDARGPQDNATFRFDAGAFRHLARTVRNGQFFTAHLVWSDEIPHVCREEGIAILHLVRDPRDVLLSRFHYVKGLERHYLHRTLLERYSTDEARILALLNGDKTGGLDGFADLPRMSDTWERFAGWLGAPGVLVVRFEELVGARGGGSDELRALTVRRLLAHCGISSNLAQVLAAVTRAQGRGSSTFRQGRAGAWRDELSPALQETLNAALGAHLQRMGYLSPAMQIPEPAVSG